MRMAHNRRMARVMIGLFLLAIAAAPPPPLPAPPRPIPSITRLSITFSDGVTRQSNVFTKKNFCAQYEAAV
jgi:hypothetical protein